MRIGNVDFPEPILSALERGQLVVFAGAGVSVDSPSEYPNFEELADRIAAGSLVRHKGENIDRFLGRLSSRGVDVHKQVKDILSSPTSQPNHLHNSLVSLYKDLSSLRIVTTNFDRHFTTSAMTRFGLSADVFCAPALPLGSDFNGIVYLHGSVDKSPKTLVLTDSDFGRAYITEGWARQFLQALFATYTILFIGYSHRDMVMNYLARGMTFAENRQTRFVLTLPGEDEHWENLGITPVHVPKGNPPASKYAELEPAVASWGEISRLGALDIEQRIKRIVEGPVPLEQADLDYVQRALNNVSTLRFFVRYASGIEWLEWIDGQDAFGKLFQLKRTATDAESILAYWFAEKFACQHPEHALALLRKRHFSAHWILWTAISHEIFRHKPSNSTFSLWVPILIRASVASGTVSFLEYLLSDCRFPDGADAAVLLFRHLTTPVSIVEDRYGSTAGLLPQIRAEISTVGSEYWLASAWKNFFLPNLARFAAQLLVIVTDHLAHAHSLLRCYSQNSMSDSLSFARGMIESRQQDNLHSGISVVVDIGAEIVRWSAASDPSIGSLIPVLWMDQESTLLRRLAVYSVSVNGTLSPDEKIAWALQHDMLNATDLKHEFYLLIGAAYPGSGLETRKGFLSQVISPRSYGKEAKAYETFNLLTWLTDKAPDCELAASALRKISELHPKYQRRERLDMSHWMSEAVWGDQTPTGAVLSVKEWSLAEIVAGLEKETSPLVPYSGEIHADIRAALSESLAWGVRIAREACDAKVESQDLWEILVNAWATTPTEKREWHEMLTILIDCSFVHKTHLHAIGSALERAIRAPQGISSDLLPDAIKLADSLWPLCIVTQELTEESDDWLQVAINTTAGNLISFYLHALSKMSKGESGDRIPSSFKQLFLSVVTGDSFSAAMGRVLLAAQITFLYSLDNAWTLGNVLPLLDRSANPARARQCWHGYTMWGRWTDTLLPHLLPLFVQQFEVLIAETSEYRRVFCDRLAGIALFSELNPIASGWLSRFIQTVSPADRLSWASALCTMLQGLDQQAQQATWTRWLKEYWTKRTSGVPVPIDKEEALAFVRCALALTAVFDETVTLVCSGIGPDLRNSTIYYSLSETAFSDKKPASMSRLVLFLLRSESGRPIHDLDKLHGVVLKLIRAGAPRATLLAILDELARVGSPDASKLREDLDDSDNPES